jgi:ribosomal protein L10
MELVAPGQRKSTPGWSCFETPKKSKSQLVSQISTRLATSTGMASILNPEDFTPEFMTELRKTMTKPIVKVSYSFIL